jgi:hypothetical protein
MLAVNSVRQPFCYENYELSFIRFFAAELHLAFGLLFVFGSLQRHAVWTIAAERPERKNKRVSAACDIEQRRLESGLDVD